jgi:hypothetical protein
MSDPDPDDEAQQTAPARAAASSVAAARKLAELLASPLAPVPRADHANEPARPPPPVRRDPPYRPAAAAATTVEPARPPPAVATPRDPSPPETAASQGDTPPVGRDSQAELFAETLTRLAAEAQALDDAPPPPVPPRPPPSDGVSEPGPGESAPVSDAAMSSTEPPGPSDAPGIVSSDAAASPDLTLRSVAPEPARSVEPEADDGEPPLAPDAARLVRRVRRLMLVSSLTTVIAVAAVFGVIGYRVFRTADRPPPPPPPVSEPAPPAAPVEATITLPHGARIIHTTVAEGLLVVALDIDGAIEMRTYDLKTLKPAARMGFTFVP